MSTWLANTGNSKPKKLSVKWTGEKKTRKKLFLEQTFDEQVVGNLALFINERGKKVQKDLKRKEK